MNPVWDRLNPLAGGPLIPNEIAFETTLWLLTVMLAAPESAIRLAGTVALRCDESVYRVVSGEPFHWMTALCA